MDGEQEGDGGDDVRRSGIESVCFLALKYYRLFELCCDNLCKCFILQPTKGPLPLHTLMLMGNFSKELLI